MAYYRFYTKKISISNRYVLRWRFDILLKAEQPLWEGLPRHCSTEPVGYYILEVAIVRVRAPFYFEGYVKHGKDGLGKIQI